MFLTKTFVAYTVLAVLCKVTGAFGFGAVVWWFVFLPLLLALAEPAWYMWLALRSGSDDDDLLPPDTRAA
ncbi:MULTISPECIES: hypothetical protein [unclassified Cupriavidus]|jgi:hypothetical protein|uniref:hypothetical protein n=1 Tax=unclassified Cupriavidus TaxID=2640874 RepID=UPI003213328D